MTHPLLSDAVVKALIEIWVEQWFDLTEGDGPLWTDFFGDAKKTLEDVFKALTDAGYVVVPKEPTETMIVRDQEAFDES